MIKTQLAFVIPSYNEELCIENTAEKLLSVIDDLVSKNKISDKSFLYFIDDGSNDNTWGIIRELHSKDNRIKGVKLLRNYGNQKALIAGLEGVRELGCDCCISIDADLQQDEKAAEKFIDEYKKGFDIVSGIRNDRKTDTFFKKFTAQAFYKTMNILGVHLIKNNSDYRLTSRRALEILKEYPEKQLFLRGFFHESGLKASYIHFDVKPRAAGKSKFNYASLTLLALNGITSYSSAPLRIIAVLGFLMFLLGLAAGIETVFEKLLWNNSPDGLATAIILVCAFGGIQIFCLGIIGEYIGQLYEEVKARPRYIKDVELI